MSGNLFRFKYDEYGNTREIVVYGSGASVGSCNYINKGTAFSPEERVQLGIDGSLPAGVRTLEQQVAGAREKVLAKKDDLDKYVFFRALFGRNATLAHAVISTDLPRFIKIIYTPTVGLAVQNFSSMFRQAHGVHFHPGNINKAEDILRRFSQRDIRVAVVTDNHGILGLGDQGAGGIAVCLGKLMVYTQGAGIAPWHCLPITLDVGTDNETLLADEQYLGWRNRRLEGEAYLSFIGRFVRAFRNVFPNALCQWEDFSTANAFSICAAFHDEIISFNDDVRGVGAAALATILSAMKVKEEKLENQNFLIHGGGPSAIGVAMQIRRALVSAGLDEIEACERIFILREDGLLVKKANMPFFKADFAKDPEKFKWIQEIDINDASAIVHHAGVTTLIGTTGENSFFTGAIASELKRHTDRPVVLLLFQHVSTPEIFCQNVGRWAAEGFLLASGHSCNEIDELECSHGASQCNSAMIFPGVALGVLVSGAREVFPEFFDVAAEVVSSLMSKQELERGRLMPRVAEIDTVARKVALEVAMSAVEMGVARPCVYADFAHNNDRTRMAILIDRIRWRPEYLPLTPL